jgi:hypothetical protein
VKLLAGLFGRESEEVGEARMLAAQLEQARGSSSVAHEDGARAYLSSILEEAGATVDASVGMRIGAPVVRMLATLFHHEPFSVGPVADPSALSLSEGSAYRDRLRHALRVCKQEDYYLGKWKEALVSILGCLYAEFPEQAFVDPDEEGRFEEFSRLSPTAPLYTYVKRVRTLIHNIIATVFAPDLTDDRLFEALRDQLLVNLATVSQIPVDERYTTNKAFVMPEEAEGSDSEILLAYLRGTPFLDVFLVPVPLYIPEAVRFEHTHIVAGTGHGKTQTLQFLIAGDCEAALTDRRSIVVMDSQGDLLQTLMRSEYLATPELRDRFVYIDPTDLERPVGLNLFDVDLTAGGAADPVARETILNNTVELFDYFFGALLGADLTQKQGLVFRYVAVLLMQIPGATIHTFRELMEDGSQFRPYMERLGGSARVFFETRFFDRAFAETKKQVLHRLWGVLANQTLDRMMSAPKNSIDLFSKLQEGSIVFINTAKDFFGEEGSAIFGRMFVALLGQALIRRAAIPKHERTPTYIYMDEAERLADETLVRMLAQVRKYKGAITFALQNLDQMEPGVRAGVMANTSIKLAGGVSAKDAGALAPEFRCEPGFLLSQRRTKQETTFACFAKNVTDHAFPISIPLGYVEDRLSGDERALEVLVESSRQKYGVVYVEPKGVPAVPEDAAADWLRLAAKSESIESMPEPGSAALCPRPQDHETSEGFVSAQEAIVITRAPARAPPESERPAGGGGVKHKQLQAAIKEKGEERGFLASLEDPVRDGEGRVDVVLSREGLRIAFEISITTSNDHELRNIEKCLSLPFAHVVMLTSQARRLKSLSRYISKALDEEERKRVTFLLPEDLPAFLDSFERTCVPNRKVVKGYTVRTRVADHDPSAAVARRRAIAAVVARSLES